MQCPFRYRKAKRNYRNYSFGVSGDFMDFVEEREDRRMAAEDQREREFNEAHPTCWNKFLFRLGLR